MKEKGFKELTQVDEALESLLSKIDPLNRVKEVPLAQSGGRIVASPVTAPRSAPHYRRAAMDGFAVRASDTFGATESSPNRIELADSVRQVTAVPVHTGGFVPGEADAVLKIEDTRKEGEKLAVYSSLAPGDNVSPVGEDVEQGDLLIDKGDEVQPSHLGLLRTLGVESVPVLEKPGVAVLPTGEELVPSGEEPGPGQTVQSNGIMVSESVRRWGGAPEEKEILSDEPEKLVRGLDWGLEGSDVVAFTGGSSVGRRDRIVEVLEDRGEVLVHGVAIQPGKPVALAMVKDKPVIALPGYPVATLADAYFFLRPLLAHLNRRNTEDSTVKAKLARKIHSKLGKLSLVRVAVEDGEATPVRVSGSGVLSSVTRSDGFVLVPEDSEGIAAGEEVELHDWR